MNIARTIPAFLLALLVTTGLLLAMDGLIRMAEPELGERNQFKLPDFVHVPKDEQVKTITPKPKRPDEIQEQPDVPDLEVVPDNLDVNSDISLATVKVGINKNLKGFNSNDGEYLPIFRAPPVYPRRATERGLCGYVDLVFTVTSAGGVADPQVTASSSKIFERAAIKAALKYKYKPRQVGGKPVDVPGVEIRIKFEIEGGC